jgi:membrane protein involved in colicin uptake
MGRTLRILLPCALGLIAALLVSCGDTSHLIPGTDADAINQNIDAAASASGDGRCSRADSAVQRAQTHVAQLPSSVDPKLKADLEQGLARLRATAASECADNHQQTETTATTESTASTESTESTASTESTETQNTETQNTDTSGTDTTGGNGNNGNGNGNGGGTDNGQGQGGGNGGTSAP